MYQLPRQVIQLRGQTCHKQDLKTHLLLNQLLILSMNHSKSLVTNQPINHTKDK
jgi:hypothetical protein